MFRVRESPNWFEPATIVVCHNCGHCSELRFLSSFPTDFARGCPSIPGMNVMNGCDDMDEVNRVRGEVVFFIIFLNT